LLFFTIQVTCEALGSPRPTLQWLKDGYPIRDSVLPRPSSSSDQQSPSSTFQSASSGVSTVELQVLGTADDGIYTCRAGNDVGVRDHNYTLTVTNDDGSAASKLHAIVTEAGPENGTDVRVGDAAVMRYGNIINSAPSE
jgi:hypothetical protein